MTDGLDQALVNAVLALLTADAGLTVYDGATPPRAQLVDADDIPLPYVLVYTDLTRPAVTESGANTLDGKTRHRTAAFYCHCVGPDAVGARAVAQRVRTQLLDVRPVVVGLSCNQISEVDSSPPQRDESTGVLVMDALAVYELYASA